MLIAFLTSVSGGPAVWNLANMLSMLRIALAPVAIVLIRTQHWGWAIVVVLLAGVTDNLDGLAARKLGLRTDFGEKLDPIADKILLVSLFLALTFTPDGMTSIPLWLTCIVIGRDLMISAGALAIRSRWGITRFPPTFLGKISTTVQIVMVLGVLIQGALFDLGVLLALLFGLTTLATAVSGIDYLWHGIVLFRSGAERQHT